MPRPLALAWAFNTALFLTAFAAGGEWADSPWVSRLGVVLLAPICSFFAVAWCSADATGRRICLGLGAFFLGLGLFPFLAVGPVRESFGQALFVLSTGAGLWIAAATGRACPLDGPDPARPGGDPA